MNIKEAIQSIEQKCINKFLKENPDRERIIMEGRNQVIFKLKYKESTKSNTRDCKMECFFVNDGLDSRFILERYPFDELFNRQLL